MTISFMTNAAEAPDVPNVPDDCKQLVVVTAGYDKEETPNYTSSKAVLEYWERDVHNPAVWHKIISGIAAQIGENGMWPLENVEDNESCTPEGIFPLGLAFGHTLEEDLPFPVHVEYRWADADAWWDTGVDYWTFLLGKGVSKSASTYNQWVTSRELPDRDPQWVKKFGDALPEREAESLGPEDRNAKPGEEQNYAYDLAIFVDHNPTNTPGKSCAIFLHCTDGVNQTTAGCIQVKKTVVANILRRLQPEGNPHLAGVIDGQP